MRSFIGRCTKLLRQGGACYARAVVAGEDKGDETSPTVVARKR